MRYSSIKAVSDKTNGRTLIIRDGASLFRKNGMDTRYELAARLKPMKIGERDKIAQYVNKAVAPCLGVLTRQILFMACSMVTMTNIAVKNKKIRPQIDSFVTWVAN
jgi:hypothetical protein